MGDTEGGGIQTGKDVGPWEGPRDKLLNRGSKALSDEELLAVLLSTGRRGLSATGLGRKLLCRGGGLAGLMSQPAENLLAEPGLGPAKLATLKAALEFGRRCAEEPLRERSVMASPQRTRAFLKRHLGCEARGFLLPVSRCAAPAPALRRPVLRHP